MLDQLPPQQPSIITVKFGGAVLRSPDGFRHMLDSVRSIVLPHTDVQPPSDQIPQQATRPSLLVVVSAFASTTRDLEAVAHLAQSGNIQESHNQLSKLANVHLEYVKELLYDDPARPTLELLILETAREVGAIIDGISIIRQLTPHTLDRILAFGELLALHIARHVLIHGGITAAWTDARRLVVTDSTFGSAIPNPEKTLVHVNRTLKPLMLANDCVLVQGFVGATTDGTVTTMGRESSTLTATLLGALLGADEVRLYSDVPGVCSADPKVFAHAITHQSLSFAQAAIAAHHGLKLLYTTTIEPAQTAGISVKVIDAAHPERATTISGEAATQAPIVIIHPHESARANASTGANATPTTNATRISIVLARESEVLACLGTLASEFNDADTWYVRADPTEQVVELQIPSDSAMTIARRLHDQLIRTLQ